MNQRQSIGWKIDSLGYKVPNPDAVVAYLSCPTQYRINVNARPDMKNQFTDYDYGYMSDDGKYFHPEQVHATVVYDEDSTGYVNKFFVRGTTTEVKPVKMTKLVRPINGGKLGDDGKKEIVVGTTPTSAYALKSNPAIRFLKDQVVKYNGKYYIKGLEKSESAATAEVVELPQSWEVNDYLKADGTGVETRTVVDEGVSEYNKTRGPRIDG